MQRSQREVLSLCEQFLLPFNHLIDFLDIKPYILDIIASFDPSVGEDTLGDATGTQSHDGLFLLHDEDVVQAVFAGTGVAGVLEITGHILLSVEIIRLHSKLFSSRCRDLHGLVCVVEHGDAVLLDPLVQTGCTFDGQGMNGQAVRGQFHDLFDGAL